MYLVSQNIGQSLDFGDTLEQTRRITEEGTAAVTSAVNEANAHMLQSLKELNDQLVSNQRTRVYTMRLQQSQMY